MVVVIVLPVVQWPHSHSRVGSKTVHWISSVVMVVVIM